MPRRIQTLDARRELFFGAIFRYPRNGAQDHFRVLPPSANRHQGSRRLRWIPGGIRRRCAIRVEPPVRSARERLLCTRSMVFLRHRHRGGAFRRDCWPRTWPCRRNSLGTASSAASKEQGQDEDVLRRSATQRAGRNSFAYNAASQTRFHRIGGSANNRRTCYAVRSIPLTVDRAGFRWNQTEPDREPGHSLQGPALSIPRPRCTRCALLDNRRQSRERTSVVG